MDALATRLLTILEGHRGLAQAVSVPELAKRLGLGRGKAAQRRVQVAKRELADAGYPVGSSCGHGCSGYYWAVSVEEIQATLNQYSSRFYALSKLIKQTRKLLPGERSPQLGLCFEEGRR